MTTIDPKERWLRAAAAVGFAVALGFAAPAYAQDEEQPAAEEEQPAAEEAPPAAEAVVEEAEAEAAKEDKIIVTGSRIGRDEFSSAAPVQIITGEVSREIGLVDTASILQESSVSTGLQIDRTFAGFVLDNGPGASTVDLRGLDPGRTLVLINGRRLAPGGVEGAPANPDINLVPSALVERYEILLDGASSVYGSDAVAGVVNVILRRDFEGFELEAFRTQPEIGAGEETVVSATWGANYDKGFIGFGAEYSNRAGIRYSDRDFLHCPSHLEDRSDGSRGTIDTLNPSQLPGTSLTECYALFYNRFFIPGLPGGPFQFGSIYYTPGFTNTGIPDFSETSLFGALVDGDMNGLVDVDIKSPMHNLWDTDTNRQAHFVTPQESILFYTYGEHQFELFGSNITSYFEASFAQRKGEGNAGAFQLFPDVPANNPFNPCNINTGVDCGEAFNNTIISLFGAPLSAFGLPDAIEDVSYPVTPIIHVLHDRNEVEFNVLQYRLIGGFKGDLPFLNDFGPLNNWVYDIHGSYSRALGTSVRRGVREDRLMLSLTTTIEDPANPGTFICGLDFDGDGIPDPDSPTSPIGSSSTPPCVPVNMFAPSLFQSGGGDFATQEEHDFLFGKRVFTTEVEQVVLQGYIKGELFKLPAGTLDAVLGFEYREDKINSLPDDNAEDGTFFGFFLDPGASGGRDLYEAFMELKIPVVAAKPFMEELSVEFAGRWTEEQFYGTGLTYSVKGLYRPTNYLTFRGTYGTSFRAPNLREQFLKGTSGFLNVFDPCIVPDSAQGAMGTYDPAGETRDPQTLANCQLAGVDPFSLGLGTFGAGSAEIVTGGSTDLEEETSRSFTSGIVFEQPFTEWFKMTIGATYFDILVKNSIIEPGTSFIVSDCYVNQPNLSSPFCNRVIRDVNGFIQSVDTSFINRDEDTAKGIDFNVLIEKEFRIKDNLLEITIDADATYMLERGEVFIDDSGDPNFDDNLREQYFPDWRALFRLIADYRDFRLSWATRFIANTANPVPDGFSSGDTCPGTGLLCQDVDYINDYWEHDVSVAYLADTWAFRFGVRNVTDRDPPLLDFSETFTATNVVTGGGFDLFGRTYFFNVQKKW